METIYVSYRPPKAVAIKMTKGPYMFKSFLASWNFKALDSNRTDVRFLYSFELRFPYSLVKGRIKKVLSKNVQQRLVDLKDKMELS